jgi:hypothetical protein
MTLVSPCVSRLALSTKQDNSTYHLKLCRVITVLVCVSSCMQKLCSTYARYIAGMQHTILFSGCAAAVRSCTSLVLYHNSCRLNVAMTPGQSKHAWAPAILCTRKSTKHVMNQRPPCDVSQQVKPVHDSTGIKHECLWCRQLAVTLCAARSHRNKCYSYSLDRFHPANLAAVTQRKHSGGPEM